MASGDRQATRPLSGAERYYLDGRRSSMGAALASRGLALGLLALPVGFLLLNGGSWRALDGQSLAGLAATAILSLLVVGILFYGPGATKGPAGWGELKRHKALGEDLQLGRLHWRQGAVRRRWTKAPRGRGQTRYWVDLGPGWTAELSGARWLALQEGMAVEAWLAPASGEVLELNGQAHRLPISTQVVQAEGPDDGGFLPPAA